MVVKLIPVDVLNHDDHFMDLLVVQLTAGSLAPGRHRISAVVNYIVEIGVSGFHAAGKRLAVVVNGLLIHRRGVGVTAEGEADSAGAFEETLAGGTVTLQTKLDVILGSARDRRLLLKFFSIGDSIWLIGGVHDQDDGQCHQSDHDHCCKPLDSSHSLALLPCYVCNASNPRRIRRVFDQNGYGVA